MAVHAGLGCSNVVSVSSASLCPCSRSPSFFKPLELSFASAKFRLTGVSSDGIYGIPVMRMPRHRIAMAVARAEPDRLDEGEAKEVGIF